jgi:hypothetical protein
MSNKKYITHKTLGGIGNLGSQIQQYASLHAIAKATNRTIIFPPSSLDYGIDQCSGEKLGFKFNKVLDIPIEIYPEEFFNDFINITHDTTLQVDTRLYTLPQDNNYNLTERFDLYHYWYSTCKEDIINWKWNSLELEKAKNLYNQIPSDGKETVAIHVRRGDYLEPKHNLYCNLADTGYYNQAIEDFIIDIEKYHFVVFSNDIDWCKDNLIEGDMITFIKPGSDYTDMILMSLCDHFIIANSSYSWWAAFKGYNPNKKIICPANYINTWHPFSSLINKNYYPKDWKIINNIA